MSGSTAVFFDLDATLVAYDSAVADALFEATWREAVTWHPGLDLSSVAARHRPIVIDLWRKAEDNIPVSPAGAINGLDVLLETFRQTLAACGCDDGEVAKRCFDFYWSHREAIFSAYDDVEATLRSLRTFCKLAVITNGPCVTQPDKLKILGLDRYFDFILCSGDLGAAKPDPAIFRHVLDTLGATPARTFHVGDNLMADVAGANAAGLTSVWINRTGHKPRPGDPVPHHEITSLMEILPIVRTMTGNDGAGPARA